jgi:hypothetical protein
MWMLILEKKQKLVSVDENELQMLKARVLELPLNPSNGVFGAELLKQVIVIPRWDSRRPWEDHTMSQNAKERCRFCQGISKLKPPRAEKHQLETRG